MLLTTATLLASLASPLAAADTACIVTGGPVETRRSPLDSATVHINGATIKFCYGRPSLRGRTMIGGADVPYGKLWRTGADEPTMIHTTAKISVAGIEIEPGTYSFYTVPNEREWGVIVNRSTSQWGRENRYTDEVRAQEVARSTVKAERLDESIETFTIRPAEDASGVYLEWEHARVFVPLKVVG